MDTVLWIVSLVGMLGMSVGLLGIWRLVHRTDAGRYPAPVDNANLERCAIRGPFLPSEDRR